MKVLRGILLLSLFVGAWTQQPSSFTITTNGTTFEELRAQIQEQANQAVTEIQGDGDQLQTILSQLGVAIAQSVAIGMVDLLENPGESTDSIATKISEAIGTALATAAESSDRLSGLDAASVQTDISTSITNILTNRANSTTQDLTQSVAQEVLDIIGNAFTEVTGGTFSATIDVSAISTNAPLTFTTSSDINIQQVSEELTVALNSGNIQDYNVVITLLINLLSNGGQSQFLDILSEFSTGANRQFLVQLLTQAFQNADFPAWAFVNALGTIPSGQQEDVAKLLADVIVGSQSEAAQLSEAFVYAVSSGSAGLDLLNLALSEVAKTDGGCENLRIPLTAAQELAISRGVSAQLLTDLNQNQAIDDCLQEGVQLTVQLSILGDLDNPTRLADQIREAAIDGESNQIANTLITGIQQNQLDNLKLTLEFVFKDEQVPVDTFVRSLGSVQNIGGQEARNALSDIFIEFASNPDLSMRLSLFIRFAFSEAAPEVVTAFTEILTTGIDTSSETCAYTDALQEALSGLEGTLRETFVSNIESNDALKNCLGEVPEDTPEPTPTPTPAPDAVEEVSPEPTPTPDATEEVSPEPTPTPDAAEEEVAPEPTPTPTPVPDATEEVSPEPTPTPDSSEEVAPEPTPTPSPTPDAAEEVSPEPTPTPDAVEEVSPESTPTPAEVEEAATTPSTTETVFSTISENNDLSVLVNALIKVGFETTLSSEEIQYTIFAPTNAAWNRLAKDFGVSLEQISGGAGADQEQLIQILDNHLAVEPFPSSQLTDGLQITSVDENFLNVNINNGDVSISTVGSTGNVVQPDIMVGNSVIHIVDEVLLPFKKPELQSVIDTARGVGELSSFVLALEAGGVSFPSNVFTIFAPSNDAFNSALETLGITFEQLAADSETLANLLFYHVVSDQRIRSDEFFDGQELQTLDDDTLNIIVDDSGIVVVGAESEASVDRPDIYANNAIIHIIDNVLLPSGSIQVAVEPTTTTTDDEVEEDTEVSPEPSPTPAPTEVVAVEEASETDEVAPANTLSILDALQDNDISVLFSAILRAGLEADLSDPSSSLTLFAPTSRAFDKLLSDLNTTLDNVDVQVLSNILLQHVAVGRFISGDLVEGQELPTLVDQDLVVRLQGNRVFVKSAESEARIQIPDILAGDSVIHVINTVLVPGEEEEEVEEPEVLTIDALPDPINIELQEIVCEDKQPPNFTCQQQLDFGKCDAGWMIDGKFCEQTCGRCPTSTIQQAIEEASTVIETVVGAGEGVCGCTCDEDKMRAMIREEMAQVLQEYMS